MSFDRTTDVILKVVPNAGVYFIQAFTREGRLPKRVLTFDLQRPFYNRRDAWRAIVELERSDK